MENELKIEKIKNLNFAVWIENLMSRLKIERLITNLGGSTQSISVFGELTQFLQDNPQGFVVLDLENSSLDLKEFKLLLEKSPDYPKRIICFFPHVEIQLKNRAKEAGIQHIFPRSVIFGDFLGLLEKIVGE